MVGSSGFEVVPVAEDENEMGWHGDSDDVVIAVSGS